MKILVTGGLGFIGSHTVVELMQNKHEVCIVDNFSNSKMQTLGNIQKITGKTPKLFRIDLCNKNLVMSLFEQEHPQAVIHFAGFKAVGESCEQPLKYYKNNIQSTINVLEAMEAHPECKHIIFSSSATVYGVPHSDKTNPSFMDGLPLTEDSPVQDATSPYGQTKIINERILQDWAKVNPQKNVAILRYFNPIGAHPSGLLGENPNGVPNNLMPYINKVATGELPVLKINGGNYDTPDGTAIRDYIHVVDLARGHVLALNKLQNFEGVFVCNLGSGKGTSVLELIDAYQKATGVKINFEFGPRRPGDVVANFASIEKAKRELGFECQYTIEDACKHTYAFQVGSKIMQNAKQKQHTNNQNPKL